MSLKLPGLDCHHFCLFSLPHYTVIGRFFSQRLEKFKQAYVDDKFNKTKADYGQVKLSEDQPIYKHLMGSSSWLL